MPRTTYTEEEVDAIIRIAYTTGVRDAVIAAQGHPLSDAQAKTIERFITDRDALKETRKRLLPVAGALAWQETRDASSLNANKG